MPGKDSFFLFTLQIANITIAMAEILLPFTDKKLSRPTVVITAWGLLEYQLNVDFPVKV